MKRCSNAVRACAATILLLSIGNLIFFILAFCSAWIGNVDAVGSRSAHERWEHQQQMDTAVPHSSEVLASYLKARRQKQLMRRRYDNISMLRDVIVTPTVDRAAAPSKAWSRIHWIGRGSSRTKLKNQRNRSKSRKVYVYDQRVHAKDVPKLFRTRYDLEMTNRYYDYYWSESMSDMVPQRSNSTIDGPRCQVVAEWQTKQISTCNHVHSLDMRGKGWLGSGTYRDAWNMSIAHPSLDDPPDFVIKTLKPSTLWAPSLYNAHQREAAAMSQMSKDYVLDIYGSCGFTLLVERGSSWTMKDDVQKRVEGGKAKDGLLFNPIKLLKLSSGVARAVADCHVFDNKKHATVAHFDLKPDQFCRSKRREDASSFKWLLGDFNWSRFLRYKVDRYTGELKICPQTDARPHTGRFRAPEELTKPPEPWQQSSATLASDPWALTDRTDVYNIGGLLYYLATGPLAFDVPKNGTKRRTFQDLVFSGEQLPLSVFNVNDADKEGGPNRTKQVIARVIRQSRAFRATERPTSAEVADMLQGELTAVLGLT